MRAVFSPLTERLSRLERKTQIFLAVFLLFIGVMALFAYCPQRASGQGPPEGGTPGLKRLFNGKELGEISQAAEKARQTGWRKEKAGHYFSFIKLFLLLLTFWSWVGATSWANTDAERLGDPDRIFWNSLQMGIFPAAFFPALLIPIFWIAFPVILLAFLVPCLCYVAHRNAPLLAADKVLTFEHLVFLTKKLMGVKVEAKKMAYELGSPIKLACATKGISEQDCKGQTILARNMPGYNSFREILYNSIKRNATSVTITIDSEGLKTQYQIDGVWHPIEGIFKRPLPQEEITGMSASIKVLIGADPDVVKNRLLGQFTIEYDKRGKINAEIAIQTGQAGEQLAIRYVLAKIPFNNLNQIGMYPDRQETFKKSLNAENGVFVLSATNGQGLKTLTNVAFNVADRFTRDFSTVEDVQNLYMGIENVTLCPYDSAKGQKPMDVLPDLFFREPKVVLLRDFGSVEALTLCCQEVENDRVIITTFRGKDSVDTIMKLLATGVDHELLGRTLSGVVTQKLVRILCEYCKEEVPANPQMLQRLGLKPDAVETIFQKRVHHDPPPGQKDLYVPCQDCQEIGYKGRTAIFDFLHITDEIRAAIIENPTEANIRQAVAKSGQRGYIVDGARLITDGLTSFDELARSLKS